jgi:probable phosphomutase (TIGR03848 family)
LATVPTGGKQPSITYVCFVRHGTTPTTGKVMPGRAPGLHLSDVGRREARDVAERLGALGTVRAVYSSPLERTRETAETICERLDLALTLEDALMDCDCGDWTGIRLAQLRRTPEWRRVIQQPSGFRFPNGESFRELENRVGEVVERIVEKHPGEVVVAVSHADPIKLAISRALGSPLDLFDRAAVRPCSTTVIAYGQGAPSVLTLNSFDTLTRSGIPSSTEDKRSGARAAAASPTTR